MKEYFHRWKAQPVAFVQESLGNWVAITHRCSCGEIRGFTADSSHKDAAKLAYELERAGDFYLTPGALSWLAARRTLCPI